MKGRHFSSDAEVIAAAETWLDGQPSDFFFEWLAEVRVWSLYLVSFLVELRTYQHPGIQDQALCVCCVLVVIDNGSYKNCSAPKVEVTRLSFRMVTAFQMTQCRLKIPQLNNYSSLVSAKYSHQNYSVHVYNGHFACCKTVQTTFWGPRSHLLKWAPKGLPRSKAVGA